MRRKSRHPSTRPLRAPIEPLEPRRLLSAALLADVATTIQPQQVIEFSGNAYFVAYDPSHGYELWKTNGTGAGTAVVKDINPGPASSHVSSLAVANGKLYFAATDGVHGSELWTTDGSAAGTTMVADLLPGSEGSAPALFTSFSDAVFFAATDAELGRELWKTDGTASGTSLVIDVNPGAPSTDFVDVTATGAKLYFSAQGVGLAKSVWATDGTQAGSLQVTNAFVNVHDLYAIGTTVFFQGINTQLWKTDGTLVGTGLVKDPAPAVGSTLRGMSEMNGILYFHTSNLANGEELWRSDGTAAGTYLVKDIYPGSDGGVDWPSPLVAVNGTIFFVANDGTTGDELWKSDGTAAGTVLVKDVYAGSSSSRITQLANCNGVLYFQAKDASSGLELWKSDGTAGGTVRVSDAAAGYLDSSPHGITAVGGSIVFLATNSAGSGSLWKTTGTLVGTSKIRDIQLPTSGGEPHDLTVMGDALYFVSSPGGNREQLWKTDGTPGGTVLVADINSWYYSSLTYLTTMGGKLFFVGADTGSGTELWVSDGTPDGTHMLKDIAPGYGWSDPENLTVVGNTLYFSADDGVNGRELWKSDGTAAGTVMVKDIFPGPSGSSISNIVSVNGSLHFTADNGTKGVELWISGGTAATTAMVRDINPGSSSSSPSDLTPSGTTLYFFADDGTNGRELWKYVPGGASLVKDIRVGSGSSISVVTAEMVASGGVVYFPATHGQYGTELWKSDGTASGTVLVKDIVSGSNGSSASNLVPFGNGVAFSATPPGSLGATVWLSDGTGAGTIQAYPAGTPHSPAPSAITVYGQDLYFWGDDKRTQFGVEVWKTDGTEAGTVLVKDVQPGPDSSHYGGYANYFRRFGDKLFFVADDGETGYEVWVLSPPVASVAPASTIEGGTVQLSTTASAIDPEETFMFTWDLDGDGVFGETGPTAANGDEVGPRPTFRAAGVPQGSNVPVQLRVTDSTGMTATASNYVSVSNVAPVPAILSISGAMAEGSMIQLAGSASDSPGDLALGLDLTWTVTRNGAVMASGMTGEAAEFVPPDGGTYVVTLRATDRGGLWSTTSMPFTVANVAPTATLSDSSAHAGLPATVGLTGASDVSSADMAAGLTFSFDLDGDGLFEIVDSTAPSATHTFLVAGPRTVRAKVRDKDGGETSYQATVTVTLPPPPSATFQSGGAVDEGTPGSVSFSGATGAAPFGYSFDFDNDGQFEVVASAVPSAVVPAEFLSDGPFVRTVRGRLTDRFGQFADFTSDIVVLNVAPTFAIPAAAIGSAVLGRPYMLSLGASDDGKDTITSWRVSWGDTTTSVLAATAGLLSHDYPAVGHYNIQISATDEDGSYVEARSITVTAVPPTATFTAGPAVAPGLPYRFTVTYSDDFGIDTSTLGDGDLQINGPAGTALARLVSATPSGGGTSVLAIYEVQSPLGVWASPDNGTYTVSVLPDQVRDLQGVSLPAGELGAFDVNLEPLETGDLVPTFFGTLPKSISPGEKRSLSVRVSNRGVKSIPSANLTTRIYLSTDPVLDDSDVLLGSATRRKAFPLNGLDLVHFPLPTPKVAATGKYYFLARADATDAVLERDERNNVVASTPVTIVAPSSDLSVALTGKLKPSWKPGQAIAVGMKVTNAGPSDAAGTGVLRAYFSTNPVLDSSDQLVLTSNLSLKLKSKASAVFNRSLKIPASLAKGKVYLLLTLDGSAVGDRNAGNNRVAIPLQIT